MKMVQMVQTESTFVQIDVVKDQWINYSLTSNPYIVRMDLEIYGCVSTVRGFQSQHE